MPSGLECGPRAGEWGFGSRSSRAPSETPPRAGRRSPGCISSRDSSQTSPGSWQTSRWPARISCLQDLLKSYQLFAQNCDGDRLVPLLQEVQSLSNPRPAILGHFTEELTIHMASPNNQVARILAPFLDTSWLLSWTLPGSFPGDFLAPFPGNLSCYLSWPGAQPVLHPPTEATQTEAFLLGGESSSFTLPHLSSPHLTSQDLEHTFYRGLLSPRLTCSSDWSLLTCLTPTTSKGNIKERATEQQLYFCFNMVNTMLLEIQLNLFG